MLRPRSILLPLVSAAVAMTWVGGLALADSGGGGGGGVNCGPYVGDCGVTASGSPAPPSGGSGGGSGGGGSGGGGGGSAPCSFQGHPYPCFDPIFGWFDQQNGCYYKLMDPQPPASSAWWAGHKPGDGAVYSEDCPLLAGKGLPGGNARWFQNPPPGYGGGVNVAALAQQAVSKMALVGPSVGMAPPPGTKGVVGVPVWLWDNVTPTTWGPNTATAAAGGVTVTATGSTTQIVWAMGDGSTVTCDNPGVAYQPQFGSQLPACGHVYTATSDKQPGGKYAVTATSTWVVNWTATTGQTGQITVTRQSVADVVIGELRTLNN